LPCVWVLAGVLNHRPCHRGYECEGCDLHRALGGEEKPSPKDEIRLPPGHDVVPGPTHDSAHPAEKTVSAYLIHLAADCPVHLDRAYTTQHFWVRKDPSGEVCLGLDCQNLRILFPVEDLVLPRAGVWVKRGEAMGWILRGHLAIPLQSPLSGEVLEVNEPLLSELRELGFPRTRDRWMVRLLPHEDLDAVPGLLEGEVMLDWYRQKLGLLRECLRAAMEPGRETGPTLHDGGAPNPNLEEVLGEEAFQSLVDRLFRGVA
jgi:glycine cleavage system H lipoate-binding protein